VEREVAVEVEAEDSLASYLEYISLSPQILTQKDSQPGSAERTHKGRKTFWAAAILQVSSSQDS